MKRQKKYYIFMSTLIVINMALVLTVAVGGFFYLNQLRDEADQKEYKAELLTAKEQELASLESRYSKIESDMALTTIALPEKKDISKLISDVDDLAGQSGLKITGVRFSAKEGKTTSDASLSQTVKGKYSYELPVDLDVEGSYDHFIAFITKLENYLRINNIASFRLGKTKTEEGTDQVSTNLSVTFYLSK